MIKREENKLRMYRSLIETLKNYQGVVASNQIFNEDYKQLSSIIQDIENKDQEYQAIGLAKDKNQLESELIQSLMEVTSLMSIYARRKKDQQLTQTLDLSKSDYERLRDAELSTKAQEITKLLKNKVGELEAFGISAEQITEVEQLTSKFTEMIGNTSADEASKSAARSQLTELFKSADDVVHNLDDFVQGHESKQPDLYKDYAKSKVIVDR
jgi:hypothetical protein